MDEATAFDPMSSSSLTASGIIVLALCVMTLASYSLGKNKEDKNGPGFRFGMCTIASGIFLYWLGLYFWWAFD